MEEPARQKETIHYSFLKKKKKNLKYKVLQWGKIDIYSKSFEVS